MLYTSTEMYFYSASGLWSCIEIHVEVFIVTGGPSYLTAFLYSFFKYGPVLLIIHMIKQVVDNESKYPPYILFFFVCLFVFLFVFFVGLFVCFFMQCG